MKTPFLGAAYALVSPNAAADRCINLYPEAIPQGGKEAGCMYRAPGTLAIVTVGNGPIRGAWQFGNYGYVVSGSSLYRIDYAWTVTELGTVGGTGSVSMTDNGTQLAVVSEPDMFIYNAVTGVFAQVTDTDFPGAVRVDYIDGYFVFIEPDSQRWWQTQLLDGTSVDPTEFASAEGSPDNLTSIIVDHREVWLFGTNSTEVWQNVGNPDFAFQRIQGAFIEVGCSAPFSVSKMDNTIFWLSQDRRGQGMVYRANGYIPQRISTHAIEYAISTYSDISDAVAYTYQERGHAFYVLTFPTGNATWVYDASTNLWHERAYQNPTTGQLGRHRSNCHMFYNGKHVVGDYEDGTLYDLSVTYYDDDGDLQKWLRSWRALPTGTNTLKRTFQHSLQLDCQTGVGLNGSSDPTNPAYVQGADPQAILRWSDDGGHTWGNEHWRSMGAIGEYGRRVIWRRLGSTEKLRDRVYEVSGTDPVPITLLGAELQASQGAS